MKNNKQKTDWELLPEMYRELVPKNRVKNMKNGEYLFNAFAWDNTKIGGCFWWAIDDEIDYIRSCS